MKTYRQASPARARARSIYSLFILFTLAAAPAALRADGFVIVPPPSDHPGPTAPALPVKWHRVSVDVVNQAATTTIDQVFLNPYDRDVEGTYLFPVPAGASVSKFELWIGDKPVAAEMLDSARARAVYEDIVRRLRDPGLLEYMGRGLFRARVYPIPARGEKRVRISYTEVLAADAGLVKYVYPLDTERFSRAPIREVSVSARIRSDVPILNVYSPSHKISVRRAGDLEATAGFEAADVRPDKDFALYYSLSRDAVGMSLMTWDGGADGRYFLLLASPRSEAAGDGPALPKDIVLVLDSSGSMSGTKIRQAKEAARFILNRLGREDRFALVDFDDGVSAFSERLEPATDERRAKALAFVDAIEDNGGTNIRDALARGFALAAGGAGAAPGGGGDRPKYVLFLTDGLPTVGVTEPARILEALATANGARARVFVFGVGNDVNTELLDRLALDHRGTPVYVGETEDLEAALSSCYRKIASPVVSDLALSFRGITASRVYPKTLPDLFRGSQLTVVGRFEGAGPVTAVLAGKAGSREVRFALPERPVRPDAAFEFIPRLWAARRIGDLLEEIRLRGDNPELSGEVRKLGLRYGIVTPYTSFLVTEQERLAMPAAAPEVRVAFDAKGRVGGAAVAASKVAQDFKDKERAESAESARIRYVEDKTFYLRDGAWVDSLYVEGAAAKEVAFGSDEYFALIAAEPGLAKYLAVGRSAIVVYKGKSYRIVENR